MARHADWLIKRILVLDGLPNLQDLGRLGIGETAIECLNADLKLETAARTALVAAVAHCETAKDYVSRELVVHILEDAERHIDFLETELGLAEKVGEQNYCSPRSARARSRVSRRSRLGRLQRGPVAGGCAGDLRQRIEQEDAGRFLYAVATYSQDTR